MNNVKIKPLPRLWADVPRRLWCATPPIFTGPEATTDEDIELARELFQCLDDLSKEWYRRNHPKLFEKV